MIIFRVLPSEHLISHLMDDDDGAAAAGRRPLDTTIRYERQHVHHIMMPSPEDECNDIELPGHVQTWAQLQHLPTDYLNLVDHHHHQLSGSGIHHYRDHHRPLVHVDAHGNYYTHALNPLKYSVFIILILELLERFSFYGLYMSQTNYLTGSYNENWNANMSSMEAASIISLSTAVAYTVPFVGGMLADSYLGDYKTILMGVCCFYLPGLFVIASSTFPNAWLGTTSFNATAYKIALLFLWPVGTGTIKAVVNVFGARQYHPILQRSLVESYYVQFYMVINVGAVAGCVVIPVAARSSITMAYSIPFVLLFAALLVFVAGSKRYVDVIPLGRRSSSRRPQQLQNHGVDQPTFADVAKICALIIPFNIVYGQCPTTFMVQGAVMEPFLGFIEAPSMDILDSVSVLVCGYFVSSYFYPFLAKNNIKMGTGYKFALGSAFGACAIFWSLLLESMIHNEYARSGGRINVVWQAPSYILIGAGEIFSISTAYEVAFIASPPNQKAFACAFNLFCIGGMPNMVSLLLYRICRHWFQNSSGSGNIGRIQDYSESHVANYFWVLLGIILLGVIINMLRPVRAWISLVEKRAANASSNSAPATPRFRNKIEVEEKNGEIHPLLKAQRHKRYLSEGLTAQIYRSNTMKAEFSSRNPRSKLSF